MPHPFRVLLPCLLLLAAGPAAAQTSDVSLPALMGRAKPGPGHKVLEALAGTWKVEKANYALSRPDKPLEGADLTTTREWIADGRFLHDVTKGQFNGQPYFRAGFLGFNPATSQYEWTTADNFTPILMSYAGPRRNTTIDMSGSFRDIGITGERNVGKDVPMRTVIRIEGADRHVFEIYFTPPGGKEMLADRMIYTRVK